MPDSEAARPDLRPAIRAALETADFSGSAESMAPLLRRDRAEALSQI